MERVDERIINYGLIVKTVESYLSNNSCFKNDVGSGHDNGSVLVFLPGVGGKNWDQLVYQSHNHNHNTILTSSHVAEIKELSALMEGSRTIRNSNVRILHLHSNLSPQRQKEVFRSGRKLILSTNIAETSITIADVTCVVDCGLSREISVSKRSSTSILRKSTISKASANQRSGRAGRVQPGVCLRFFSRYTYDNMEEHLTPEVMRMPLEEVVMSVLGGSGGSCLGSGGVAGFLKGCPQPPDSRGVEVALDELVNIGAVERVEVRHETLRGQS